MHCEKGCSSWRSRDPARMWRRRAERWQNVSQLERARKAQFAVVRCKRAWTDR